jgi:hypothetical protein
MYAAHQASQWNQQRSIETIQAAMRRQALILPPSPVMAQVVRELVRTPLTEDEMRLVAETALKAEEQDLTPEEVEAHLSGTRILDWLKVLANETLKVLANNERKVLANKERIVLYVTVFSFFLVLYQTYVMQYQTYLMQHPEPQPTPQVTANVPVDAEEIAERLRKRLRKR